MDSLERTKDFVVSTNAKEASILGTTNIMDNKIIFVIAIILIYSRMFFKRLDKKLILIFILFYMSY